MEPSANPFAALSLIVAPAILANASAVLAMSTSNRLARAVDRARELLRHVEADERGDERSRYLRDLGGRTTGPRPLVLTFELPGPSAGIVGASALMHGAVVLVRETRLAVANLQERVAQARATLHQR